MVVLPGSQSGDGALGQFGARGEKALSAMKWTFASSVSDSDLPLLFIYYKYLCLELGRLAAVISSSFIMITSTAALADAPIA